MTQEEHHLNLLSVFYYVMGGLIALYACFLLLYAAAGALLLGIGLTGNFSLPLLFGGIFAAIAVLLILLSWALAILTIIAGSRLKQRRSYTFCMVIAVILCLIIPLGTILGVFTIVVLSNQNVRNLFESNA